MTSPHILVAGIGNIFLGDDAFGVEVAQQLMTRELPAGVNVRDFGIRGFDLAYAILDGYDQVLLVDATARGGAPGTLYVIEPDLSLLGDPQEPGEGLEIQTHGMTPEHVLQLVKAFGGPEQDKALSNILVLGCEPATFGDEGEGAMGLSEPVAAAVDEAVAMIESLVKQPFHRAPGTVPERQVAHTEAQQEGSA